MKRVLAILLAGLLWPCVGLATQLTDSYVQLYDSIDEGGNRTAAYQMFFCDESAEIDGTGVGGGSDDCATNNWSQAVDARWATSMTLTMYEFAGGSSEIKLWDCTFTAANGATDASLVLPGVDDPSLVRSSGDLEPNSALCTDLTAGAGVTMIGTPAGVQRFNLTDRNFNYLIVEIEVFTGDGDFLSTLQLSR